MSDQFSEYIVFVDESGDHNLSAMNAQYPVFVLAFCIFRKTDYTSIVCPRLQEFKLRWFGHDSIILHEREIRKDLAPFQFLKSEKLKEQFQQELSAIIADTPMTIIPSIIKKDGLVQKYRSPDNPYHLALLFCMERLANFLQYEKQDGRMTHIICEQRGGKHGGGQEDRILELEFRRIMDGEHYLNAQPFHGMKMEIIPKTSNSCGLQLADLVARPIGLKCLRPLQENRAFDVIRTKFADAKHPFGGMKIFP